MNKYILTILSLTLVFLSCGKKDDDSDSTSSATAETCLSEIGCKEVTVTKRTLQTLSGFTHADTASYTVAADDNDNFYIGGVVNSGGGNGKDAYIVKFDTNSETVDSSFGTSGVVTYATANAEYFNGLTVNSDGTKIFGVGQRESSSGGHTDILLGKYDTSTGALDTSFSGDGLIIQNYPITVSWYDSGYSVSEFDDGNIYTCGYAYKNGTTGYDAVVSKYSSTGVLDTTFGSSGHLLINAEAANRLDTCHKVIELSDGKILVYGHYVGANGDEFMPFIQRYNSDWTLDTTFGTAGTLKTSLAIYSISASDRNVVIDGDDMYLVGSSKMVQNGVSTATIVKIDIADGTMDTDFGTDGVLKVDMKCDTGDNSYFMGYVELDKTFLIRGVCTDSSDNSVGFVAAILKTGELDTNFNDGNFYFHLADVTVDQVMTTVHITLDSDSAKVYTENEGVFEVYELSW